MLRVPILLSPECKILIFMRENKWYQLIQTGTRGHEMIIKKYMVHVCICETIFKILITINHSHWLFNCDRESHGFFFMYMYIHTWREPKTTLRDIQCNGTRSTNGTFRLLFSRREKYERRETSICRALHWEAS